MERRKISAMTRKSSPPISASRTKKSKRSKLRWDCEGADAMTPAPLLSVRGLEAAYGAVVALKGVDIDVHEGEIVTLIGANGAGKSTLMMTIFGKPRARAGRIAYAGRDITRLAP